MKKTIFAIGLAITAISFVGCNELETIGNKELKNGQPFEIVANSIDTKTSNDGLSTNWKVDDAMTIFHAEAGSTSYGSNDKFTIDQEGLATGKFKGKLIEGLESSKSYDWYMIYPYNKNYITPANTTCYQQIANNLTQNGYNSTAHLAGNKFPLVGKAKAVAAATTPTVSMKQICAVIKLVVTNNTGEELTISSAAITSANVNLAGGYFIDFSGDEPAIVDENVGNSENDKYMYKTVNLSVTGGTAIANGETAALYFGVKPFTAKDETLKIAVNGYEKDLVIGAEEVAFKSGYIKTVNFNVDKPIVVPDLTGDWLITGVNGENTYAMGLYSSGNNIKAISTPLSFVEGKVYETASIAEAKVTITKIADGDYAGMYSIVDTKGNYLYAASSSSNQLKTQSTMNENSAWTITPDGDNYSIIATKSSNRNILRFNFNNGSPIFNCYSSGQTPVSLFSYSKVIPNTTPTLTLKKTSISDVAAAGVTDEKETGVYTLENAEDKDVTVTFDGTVVTAASVSGGALTYTVAANTGDAREGWVKLKLGEQEAQTITISQKALAAGNTFTIKSDDVVTNSGYQKYETTVDDRTWLISFGGNQKSVGTNSNKRSNCNLSSYSKYAVSPVTTSDVASVFAGKTELKGVKKISYTFNGGSNQTSTNVYVIYSEDGETFSQLSLTSGTQGAVISSGTTYEFTARDGYFALLFKATNESGNWRIDDVDITFTYDNPE